jgi:hypothetical protein
MMTILVIYIEQSGMFAINESRLTCFMSTDQILNEQSTTKLFQFFLRDFTVTITARSGVF